MIRLVRTELRRFWGRRIVWISAGIACALILLAFVLVFRNSSDLQTNESATRRAATETAACANSFATATDAEIVRDFPHLDGLPRDEMDDWLEEVACFRDPRYYGAQDKRFFATELLAEEWEVRNLTSWVDQRPDSSDPDYSRSYDGRTEVQYRQAKSGLVGILPAVATFSLVLAVLIGASFVGAEYKSGTVENLLLWEPRRHRVLGAKFFTGFISSAALTVVVLTWLVGLFYLLANLRGTTQGVDTRFWIDIVSVTGRAAIVGGLFFIMAMSVAVIARNTTASVGLILGWFAVSNIVIELAAKGFRQYELFVNALAFISEADVPKYQTLGLNQEIVFSHNYLSGGIVVLVWAVVLSSVAGAVFIRRDID